MNLRPLQAFLVQLCMVQGNVAGNLMAYSHLKIDAEQLGHLEKWDTLW